VQSQQGGAVEVLLAVDHFQLAWLKAPGGQCFYWGELPAYQRQEPIRELEVVYREEYFDGATLLRLRDEPVLQLEIDDSQVPPPAATEPAPKQLDDLLLSAAAGRLIRLPGLGGGYVHGDDGKATGPATSQPATP
jgi:hypothetical protein